MHCTGHIVPLNEFISATQTLSGHRWYEGGKVGFSCRIVAVILVLFIPLIILLDCPECLEI